MDDIEKVEISASKVITIENLTTFNSFVDKDAFIIYLGGYHNSIRRNMIRKIYENNPNKKYFQLRGILMREDSIYYWTCEEKQESPLLRLIWILEWLRSIRITPRK